MCSNDRFEEIKKNNGNISKQVSQEIQDAVRDIDRENKEADEEQRAILV